MTEAGHVRANRNWREILRALLKLGLTSFGGPVDHLGYFRDELVTRRKWISEPAYADLVALCQFLPGPASSQVGFALELLRGGFGGALIAWAAFTLPSVLLLLAFAYTVCLWRVARARHYSWPEACCRGRRCTGRLGHGAQSLPRSRARRHCRWLRTDSGLLADGSRANLRNHLGRRRWAVALQEFADNRCRSFERRAFQAQSIICIAEFFHPAWKASPWKVVLLTALAGSGLSLL